MTILTRKYIQFNDLVIDNYDMLQSADLSGSFKATTADYSHGHGSYAVFKARQHLSAEQSLSMSLKLDTRKISCEQQKFYKDYIFLNILKPGKLWAIEGEQLLWTNAFVKDFSETYAMEKYSVTIDIDLVLYEGIWHKADPRKVFLQPYQACNFAECLDFREEDECTDCCVSCVKPMKQPCAKCLCECDFLSEEFSLCGLKKELTQHFYSQCGDSYKIIYNCEAGKKIWGEEKMLGHKICKLDNCKNIIAGQFYSHTLVDTENIIITLIGSMKDPLITLNGNTMQILGEYTGKLTLTASGEIYYLEDECCKEMVIDINNLIIPEGSTFGFIVHQGTNGIIVETNNCCDMTCIYVKEDNVTI
ncbi:hypothetical protein LI951_07070 [Enterococcus sp. BWT-B8]|uniref:hypothetical protein n=1 Tax=Enterococcus sp. BWT-B8 TaxID=2885157 RepID=UPI001E5D4DEA|nr:hypothetical protein [Enterococcus sp. BWT-B8]MCB5951821.1 hypothetical protein [Enterococcus sp. BWT-B8]